VGVRSPEVGAASATPIGTLFHGFVQDNNKLISPFPPETPLLSNLTGIVAYGRPGIDPAVGPVLQEGLQGV
jgi:hypothetical protein